MAMSCVFEIRRRKRRAGSRGRDLEKVTCQIRATAESAVDM